MEHVNILYSHLVYFTAIVNILYPFGIFHGYLVYIFFQFWYVVPRKIWQPCLVRADQQGHVQNFVHLGGGVMINWHRCSQFKAHRKQRTKQRQHYLKCLRRYGFQRFSGKIYF
jgi:hypothetical protein